MKSIRTLLLSAALVFSWSASFAAYVDPTTGRTWRQLTETTGNSWNDVSTVCSATSGACDGSSSRGTDFTGWTWATSADVGELFLDSGMPLSGFELNSTWAPNFVDSDGPEGPDTGAFFATQIVGSSYWYVQGITRSTPSVGGITYGGAAIAVDFPDYDRTVSDSYAPFDLRAGVGGVWLFREATDQGAATDVPEPNSLALVCLGFLGMAAARRRVPSAKHRATQAA